LANGFRQRGTGIGINRQLQFNGLSDGNHTTIIPRFQNKEKALPPRLKRRGFRAVRVL
jgi:hypothetical protein